MEVSIAQMTSLFGPSHMCVVEKNHTKLPYAVRLDTDKYTVPRSNALDSRARKWEDWMEWHGQLNHEIRLAASGSNTVTRPGCSS